MQALSTKLEALVDAALANYHQAQIEIRQANEHLQKAIISAKLAEECVWRSLIEQTGIVTLMDSATRRKMDHDLSTQPLELTKANILHVLQDLYQRKDTILANSLLNVFRSLTRRYKSNDKLKLTDKRIIIYIGEGFSRSTSYTDQLTDLDRIFHFLDGKQMTTERAKTLGYQACYGDEDELENDYFRIRMFKNGNAHIYFKRKDLVDQCNRLIAYHSQHQIGKA